MKKVFLIIKYALKAKEPSQEGMVRFYMGKCLDCGDERWYQLWKQDYCLKCGGKKYRWNSGKWCGTLPEGIDGE